MRTIVLITIIILSEHEKRGIAPPTSVVFLRVAASDIRGFCRDLKSDSEVDRQRNYYYYY